MGTQERREREREQRCELILQKARALIGRKRFQQMTMDRLAKECELSKGALYFYFKGKYEVLGALLLQYTSDLATSFATARQQASRPQEGLVLIGIAYNRIYEAWADMMPEIRMLGSIELYSNLSEESARALKDAQTDSFREVEACVQSGIDSGEYHANTNPLMVAVILAGASMGITEFIKRNPYLASLDSQATIEQAWSWVMASIERRH